MIDRMRNLEDGHKRNFRSIEEVEYFLEDLLLRVRRSKTIGFAKDEAEEKRPTQASVLNAILLWLEGQPAEQQLAIIGVGMRRLNALLRGEVAAGGRPRVATYLEPPDEAGAQKGRGRKA